MVDVGRITKENKKKKAGDAAAAEAEEDFMQDKSAKSHYGQDGKRLEGGGHELSA